MLTSGGKHYVTVVSYTQIPLAVKMNTAITCTLAVKVNMAIPCTLAVKVNTAIPCKLILVQHYADQQICLT